MELGWRYSGISAMGKTAVLRHKEAGVNIILVLAKGDNSVTALQRYSVTVQSILSQKSKVNYYPKSVVGLYLLEISEGEIAHLSTW